MRQMPRQPSPTAANREPNRRQTFGVRYFVSTSPICLAIRFTDAVYRPNLADISRVRAFSRTNLTSRRFSVSVQIFGFELLGRVGFIAARRLLGPWFGIETSCQSVALSIAIPLIAEMPRVAVILGDDVHALQPQQSAAFDDITALSRTSVAA